MNNFFSELKRRNVIRATILYLGAVWALAQGISQLGPSLGAPEWATRWFLVAAGIGFPFCFLRPGKLCLQRFSDGFCNVAANSRPVGARVCG